ncbi:MAG: hydroxyacid dehydrogenase [Bacteroidetes bacterium B1(2017)]|nr:MAG: hydroxyacid dehydrogenase [Bacteroidetes bacterium B1(2017)]
MKVAVFSTKPYEKIYLEKYNADAKHELVFFEASLNAATTDLTKGFEAVCVFVSDILDETTIEKLANQGVKLIDLRSAGFNNVDLTATKKHHIKVLRVPAYSPQAVAEHAVALILTLNRKTHKAYNRVREGNFSVEKLMGFNLYEKTVGIIGTGKIGTAFAKIMLGFGCKIRVNDTVESDDLKAKGVKYMTFDEVLAHSDIVSIHCPLTHETKHLFDSLAFEKMKSGAMLINTSRGAIINTSHAIVALKKGKLGYLGIDVYEQEEKIFFKDLSESLIQDDLIERLMSFHNVLITPHLGFFTEEALEQIVKITLKNFTDFENGVSSENEVT